MEKEDVRLQKALERALDAIAKGMCRNIPTPIKRAATKAVNNMTDSITGDDLITLDQACEELGVGSTTLGKLLKNGDIGTTEPLNGDGQRVGIRRKYITEYLRQRQL